MMQPKASLRARTPVAPTKKPTLGPVLLWLLLTGVSVAALGFGTSLLAAALPGSSPVASDATLTGALDMAEFRLPTLDGGRLGPPDLRGKVVVVELWATWCGPCRQQARYLEQLATEYGDRVAFLGVNTGEDEAKVRAFVAKSPFPYPVLLDPDQSLMNRYQQSSLPTVMVVDPNGRITFLRGAVVDLRTLRAEIAAAGGPTAGGSAAGGTSI